jgi:hypothetical protein
VYFGSVLQTLSHNFRATFTIAWRAVCQVTHTASFPVVPGSGAVQSLKCTHEGGGMGDEWGMLLIIHLKGISI